jgi:hypothetical protein
MMIFRDEPLKPLCRRKLQHKQIQELPEVPEVKAPAVRMPPFKQENAKDPEKVFRKDPDPIAGLKIIKR